MDAAWSIDRRQLLAVLAATAVAPGALAAGRREAPLPLWADPPGGGGPTGPVAIDAHGAVRTIAMPTIEVVRPARPSGAAMLVAAGGGYRRIEEAKEARPAAEWLAARGVTAFILRYRLPGEGWRDGPLAPLQDAQRALRLIRAQAGAFGIDPARVGVLGFSAGGHLMGLAATRSAFRSYPAMDAADTQPARADLAALAYPIITLDPAYGETSTRRMLIGDHGSAAQVAEWSVDTHVRGGCPATFLVQAEDDPVSDPRNTLLMRDACVRAGVPVDLHRLPSGGHGFGMGRPGTPSAAWPGWFATWLRGHRFIQN